MNSKKGKAISAAVAAVCLAAVYWILQQPGPSLASWLAGLPAALIVGITTLVRANDLPREVTGWRGHLRRTGFVFSGLGALSYIIMPWGDHGVWPSWEWVMFLYGVASVWVTTPHLPPWWPYITGEKKILRSKHV